MRSPSWVTSHQVNHSDGFCERNGAWEGCVEGCNWRAGQCVEDLGKKLIFWARMRETRMKGKSSRWGEVMRVGIDALSKGMTEYRAGLKIFSGSFLVYCFCSLPLTLFHCVLNYLGVSIVPIFVSSSICVCNLMTWVSYLILVCQCHPGLIYSLFSTGCHLDECLLYLFFPSALFFPFGHAFGKGPCSWNAPCDIPPDPPIYTKCYRRARFVCYLHLNSLSAYTVSVSPPPHYWPCGLMYSTGL